ncbi:MAG TPA: SDR family oxidoreductase [Chloroflexota bacterium]|nr:SDR family oxidoreductase [Chloroflexota bacterium]
MEKEADVRLQGKSAIVTGAATGIGRAIVERFAREGASVTLDYVSGQEADAQAVVKAVTDAGGKAQAQVADITNPADVQRLIEQAVSAHGGLDILVNNAGIEKKVPFLEVSLDLWQKVLAVDLTGPFLCAQAAAQQMVRQGRGGRIINISSVHEDLPMPTNAPYCAAKGGLRMLMRTMCLELAPHNITCNDIGPGAIDTPMDAPLKADPAAMDKLLSVIPLHRMGKPEDVAGLAVYLASDEAAYVTGSSYFIDGGMLRYATSL